MLASLLADVRLLFLIRRPACFLDGRSTDTFLNSSARPLPGRHATGKNVSACPIFFNPSSEFYIMAGYTNYHPNSLHQFLHLILYKFTEGEYVP